MKVEDLNYGIRCFANERWDYYRPKSIFFIDIKKGRSLIKKNYGLSQEEKTELKRLTGQMMWASTQTRPDIAFDVPDK